MEYPTRERTEEHWRIHAVAPDFRLYGIWLRGIGQEWRDGAGQA